MTCPDCGDKSFYLLPSPTWGKTENRPCKKCGKCGREY